MMKLKYVFILAILSLAQSLMAQDYHARHDSPWVYNSWQSLMEQWPDTLIINPEITAYTPYDIEFDSGRKSINKMLQSQTLAVSLGDSIWLINSDYLNRNFKGEAKKMDDYVPFFFNSKVAFVRCVPSHTSLGMALLGSLIGDPDALAADPFNDPANIYWIDFNTKKVERLTHKLLSRLLSDCDYRDLQVRFEAMKDYKERSVVNYFFNEFIDRTTSDPNYPDILHYYAPAIR